MTDSGGAVLGFSHYLDIPGMSLSLRGQYIESQTSVSFRQFKLLLLQSELVRTYVLFLHPLERVSDSHGESKIHQVPRNQALKLLQITPVSKGHL
jgi:hypothetical protein